MGDIDRYGRYIWETYMEDMYGRYIWEIHMVLNKWAMILRHFPVHTLITKIIISYQYVVSY
jgi:hypothetical protein